MIKKIISLFFVFTFGFALPALSVVRVATDLSDFAWLVKEIGGDRVVVDYMVIPYMDPHFQEPKPSYIIKLNKADLVVEAGLELTRAWLYPLIEQSRNTDLLPGGERYVFAGQGVDVIDVPSRKITRLEGDVHPMGNPHYNYDPYNVLFIARNIRDGLIGVDSEGTDLFTANHKKFEDEWKKALIEWNDRMKPYVGAKVVAYHNSLKYLIVRFNLKEVGYLEPKPGVPPSGKHLAKLARKMINEQCKAIVYEPWNRKKPIQLLAQKTGSTSVLISSGVGSSKEIESLFDMWEYNISSLIKLFKDVGYG